MNKPKKWYDDWNISNSPDGTYEVDIPNSFGEMPHHLIAKPPYTKADIHWLETMLMCALDELTRRDKESGL